uniref:Uncharacterized protein n=1 Tax=Anopheles maculatus TaxID=74869 RepID=A0A182T641_9DIPT
MGCCLPAGDPAGYRDAARRSPTSVHAYGQSGGTGAPAGDDGTSSDGDDCDGGAGGWDGEGGDGDVSAASSGERSVPAMLMMLLGPATAGSGLTNHVVIQLLHVHWV